MFFGKYDFKCTLLDNAILPPFKGSTFRGAFGSALKRVVCAVREKECAVCLLAGRCVYARTFEVNPVAPDAKARTAAIPHPYVIEPPLSTETRFQAGQAFDFSLLLFGDANGYLPYFIYAFEAMGETGIGKALSGKRARFRLDMVLTGGGEIYSSRDHTLRTSISPQDVSLQAFPGAGRPVILEVNLLTPLRLKSGNIFSKDLPFHLLVRAGLRRISSLFAAYGGGEPDIDYRGLVEEARSIETLCSSLSWKEWERWSNRQECSMLMGGMKGSISYRGRIERFLPLFELCREFHLGKQTSFGLGLFDYSYAGDAT